LYVRKKTGGSPDSPPPSWPAQNEQQRPQHGLAAASSYPSSGQHHLPPRDAACYHECCSHEVLPLLLTAHSPPPLGVAFSVSDRTPENSADCQRVSPGSAKTPETDHLRGSKMPVLTLTEKLDQLDSRYEEMTQQLSSAEVVGDSARFQKLAKQHAELSEIVAKHREFKQIEKDLAGAHQMVLEADDTEIKQMAHDEEKQLGERREIVERELKLLLLPKD